MWWKDGTARSTAPAPQEEDLKVGSCSDWTRTAANTKSSIISEMALRTDARFKAGWFLARTARFTAQLGVGESSDTGRYSGCYRPQPSKSIGGSSSICQVLRAHDG